MLKIFTIASFLLCAFCQIHLSDGLLVANSSYNNGILSISMTYNGKTPYTFNLMGQHELQFNPAQTMIELKHSEGLQARTLFSDLTDGEYWITVKIKLNLTENQHLIPMKVNDQWYVLPTMHAPLHILGRPIKGQKPHQNMLFFEVNYFQTSLVTYGGIEGDCYFTIKDETVLAGEDGAVRVKKENNHWVEADNEWGQSWKAYEYCKAVRSLVAESTEIEFEDDRGVSRYVLTGEKLEQNTKNATLEDYQQLLAMVEQQQIQQL